MKEQDSYSGTGNRQLLQNTYFLQNVLVKYIISSSFAMLSVFAGALIDTIIVGAYLGEKGLSAMSLVSPVYLIYYTAGAVIGIGGSLAGSHHIGKGDFVSYRRVFTCSLLLMLALALAMTAFGCIFLDQIVSALSNESGNTDFVYEYLRYYIMGGGFTLLAYIPLYFLKVDGRPQVSSALFFLYTLLNVVLTALFMSSIVDLGMGGAALATAISMAVTALLGMVLLFDGKGETMLAAKSLTGNNVRAIFVMGLPSGMANLFEAIRNLLINFLLLQVGAALFLPAFTVVRNVMDLLNAVMLGISSALLPLISVFFTEHDYNSIRRVFKRVLCIGLVSTGILTLAAILFPASIASLFGIKDSQVVTEICFALPLACVGSLLAYINIQLTGYYNAISRTGLSNAILFLRLICYVALSAVMLSVKFGTLGIWASFSVAEVLTLATVLLIRKRMRNRMGKLDKFLLDTSGEQAADITFSVQNSSEDIMFASNKITEFCEENEIPIKTAMKVSLAIEEMLTVIISKCIDKEKVSYIDIRVRQLDDGVMLRIRNSGRIFNPVQYYEENHNDESYANELLGIKIIIGSCQRIDFRKTFGVNNLLIVF